MRRAGPRSPRQQRAVDGLVAMTWRAAASASRSLALAQGLRPARRETGFAGQRMMHQRDQRIACAQARAPPPATPKAQAIDNDRATARISRALPRDVLRSGARPRKTVAEPRRRPASRALQFRDDAPIIGVAAGRRREIARHREGEPLHHNGASYQARATCDSEMVTRIALSSRPSRPSLPARAASASWSKMCLVRNSVVVLAPLNSRHVVEILVVERLEHRLQHLVGAADVDHDAVVVERFGDKGRVDHEGRAVQRLRRAEHRAAKRMGDHDVVADFDSEHGRPLIGQ